MVWNEKAPNLTLWRLIYSVLGSAEILSDSLKHSETLEDNFRFCKTPLDILRWFWNSLRNRLLRRLFNLMRCFKALSNAVRVSGMVWKDQIHFQMPRDTQRCSENFREYLRLIETFWDALRHCQTLWEVLRHSKTLRDTLTHFQTLSDAFRCFVTLSKALRCSEMLLDSLNCLGRL